MSAIQTLPHDTITIHPTRAALKVREIDFHYDPRWESFVIGHPQCTIYHHPAWLTALEQEYGRRVSGLACTDAAGTVWGVLPLMRTRGLPLRWGSQMVGRRIASLPRTPIAGPLAINEEAVSLLLEYAADLVRKHPGLQLQVKSLNPTLADLHGGLTRVVWKENYVLELPKHADDLQFADRATRHRVKGSIKRALKLGVRVRKADSEEDLKAWYVLYLETMRWHGSIPRPYRFFRALWTQLYPNQQLSLLLAEQVRDGRPILLSGYLLLMCGQTVHCYVNGRRRDELGLHPNDILQWEAIQEGCRRGFGRYDLGEVEEGQEGLIAFKVKWGAKPVRSYRYYYPAPRIIPQLTSSEGSAQRAIKYCWKCVPTRITAFIGDVLNSYL